MRLQQLQTEFGSRNWTNWREVLWGYQSLADPAGAIALYAASPGYAPEQGESRAHTYSLLHSLAALGRVEPGVTADAPLYGVFNNGSKTTHVAFNAGSAARTVSLSDGVTLAVAPGQLASQ